MPSPSLRVAPALLVFTLSLANPALAQRATVDVRIDTAGDTTRLVLTHSRQLAYTIRSTDGTIEIVYSEPIRLEPAEQRLDDQVLDQFRLDGRDTVVLRTGPGYRGYESFELRNPFRLVLDLKGSRRTPKVGAPPAAHRDPSRTILVIDPGHGGIETGAVGPTGLREKDVTLDLARRLRRELERQGSLSVVLTRDEDRLIGLDERTAIANHNQAVLFLSIHLNAAPRVAATGAETYFLSATATDDTARTLAALENRAAGVDEGSIDVTDNGARRDLDLVLWDLAQNRFLAQSSMLAESMQRRFNDLTGTRDRGVRQAPFRVLMGATMPAILVEAGFISNADEESRFRTPEYRNRVVEAMAGAVREFLRDLARLSAPSSRP